MVSSEVGPIGVATGGKQEALHVGHVEAEECGVILR